MTPTPRQLKLLTVLDRFWREHYRAPTVRELCQCLGVTSTSTAQSLLERMEQKGLISHDNYSACSWRLTPAGRDSLYNKLSDLEMLEGLRNLGQMAQRAQNGNRDSLARALDVLSKELLG